NTELNALIINYSLLLFIILDQVSGGLSMSRTITDNGQVKINGLRAGCVYVFTWPVVRRNLVIACFVGCALTASNQYDVIARVPFTFSLGLKLLFNFLIPFTVSSVSAAVNRPSSRP